tara:strand:+ start:233 stop:1165 length:933 start_codon:yes stop_codon:yes gene_type:complete
MEHSSKKILGINISHHPSVCIYENNKVKEFYNEERFVLTKNLLPDETTEIYQSILQKIDFRPDFVCYVSFGRNYSYFSCTDQMIIDRIQKQLDHPPYYFDIKEHHLYHAITAFYFSKFKEAAAIVVDGGGACKFFIPYQEVESIYLLNSKDIIPVYKHSSNYRCNKNFHIEMPQHETFVYLNGFKNKFSTKCVGGMAFEEATIAAGFKDANDAGKLMGLSSYAYTDKKYPLDYNKVKIAKEVQEKTFEDTCKLIDQAPSKNIILSGGYFLNCSNNFKYVKKYPQLNFFVDPIPHDAGTAIGAAIYYDTYK